jgi:hypothetical protein
LKEEGRRFYAGKYKQHFDGLFNNVGDFFKSIADDPLNQRWGLTSSSHMIVADSWSRLGQDWARLMKDLLFDSDGSLTFKPHLWKDVRTVIVPALAGQVRDVRQTLSN